MWAAYDFWFRYPMVYANTCNEVWFACMIIGIIPTTDVSTNGIDKLYEF